MIRPSSTFGKAIAVTLTFTVGTMGFPFSLVAQQIRQSQRAPQPEAAPVASKVLTAKQMKARQGKNARNPYAAGSAKWAMVYKGVDLLTGNFSTSATDLTFEGGYGIPVNVTRSYSANSIDEGPLGMGWTLSVDVRSTAGGLLKSSGAPTRTVPVNFKERHTAETDPSGTLPDGSQGDPVEAVVATDGSGEEHTQQRDVDGIITTPPGDRNTNDSEYEEVIHNGSRYSILVQNTVKTPDGTTYVYNKQGSYDLGVIPLVPGQNPVTEPSNVLKISTVTDRHGNVTTYNYSTSTVQLTKTNGTVTEKKLSSIAMANGHTITFTWGDGSTGHPTNRIWKAQDNNNVRTVTYGYDTSGNLTSVTTPAGLTTTYGYGSAINGTGGTVTLDGAANLLTSITDPRGLQTQIGYTYETAVFAPYMVTLDSIRAYKIIAPNGCRTYFYCYSMDLPPDMPGTDPFYHEEAVIVREYAPSATDPYYRFSGDARAVLSTTLYETHLYLPGTYGVAHYMAGGGTVQKDYDTQTQNLVAETVWTSQIRNQLTLDRRLFVDTDGVRKVKTETEHNFMGNPLTQTVTETILAVPGTSDATTRVATTDFAYWGADKYYQQKASRWRTGSSSYRYSYTEYFDDQAGDGKKGQTYRVYDDKRTSFTENTNTVPPGTPTEDYWKYRLIPSDTGTYSAEFDYDDKGRPIDVWKLHKTTTTPWTYVRTHSDYGSDTDGSWGQAVQVYEDYGTGKINRLTQTLDFTPEGRACEVQDAAGRVFLTDYDLDGRIESIIRTDTNPDQPVLTYSYFDGSSGNGVSKYQISSIADEVSGVTQTLAYHQSGGGIGQIASIDQTNHKGTDSDVVYTYTATGDRETATYGTDNGNTRWKYLDYVNVGDPLNSSRVFQTLNKQAYSSSTWGNTTEELHYSYNTNGSLKQACFAQTPQGTQTNYANPAAKRARAYYSYDPGGRLLQLNYLWDSWNSGTSAYDTPEAIVANTCEYEVTIGTANANRGLKTTSKHWSQSTSNSTQFALDRTETYGYDADLDYLTSADYNDGNANEEPTWTYDAAGNRGDVTVDNLNRIQTSTGSYDYEHDILGNRTWRNRYTSTGGVRYTWDVLNRMLTACNATGGARYEYRADGMRTMKVEELTLSWIPPDDSSDDADSSGYYDVITSVNKPTTRYYYDGQMCHEDDFTRKVSNVDTVDVTYYGLGARGIDRIEKVAGANLSNPTTTVCYPIYDAHGNMVRTLAKNGTGYTVSAARIFGAWGEVRNTTGPTASKGRYVANAGHIQDDETGLLYMRARYYQSSLGRFLSEDGAMDGSNWFTYCNNNPVNRIDVSGKLDTRPGPGALLAFLADLLTVALSKFGIKPDDKMMAAFFATSEAAKALTFLEGSIYLLNTARITYMFGVGTAANFPGFSCGLMVTALVTGALAAAATVAAVVTIINASYTIAMMFVED
jgi:RHS repeat-associated protein